MPVTARHIGRILGRLAVVLAATLALAVIAVLILTRTDWGRERVRRFAVDRLERVVNGRVTIGRISGNLLTGATVDAFALHDSAGQPFIVAERVSAKYNILDLLTRKIDLHDVFILRPLVVLDRPPGGRWNYQVIFAADDTSRRGTGPPRLPWIVFHDVTIQDGRFIMRNPWSPDPGLSPAAQDSSAREALRGGTRLMVVRAPGGYQKVVELRDLSAKAPLVRIRQPGFTHRLANIASLQMVALPFRPPAANVTDLLGNIRFDNDSIWWYNVAVRMPGSRLRCDGWYSFETGDLIIGARARPASFADFRWVYPRFPSEGGGPLNFAMEWKGTTEEYRVSNADVRTQGARLRGRFAISFADTFAIHDTDVRFSNVNMKLVEQLVPDFDAPRPGTMDGSLTILGGRNAMRLAGNVAFHDPQFGTSRASGAGFVGYVNGEFRMRDLRLRASPLQVALIKSLSPTLTETLRPIGGTIDGDITLNGTTETYLAIEGDVEHRDRGNLSRLAGTARFAIAEGESFDIDLEARPISLAEVGLFVPDLGLRGTASGPISVSGTLDRLRLATALRLQDGGFVEANGTLALGGRTPRYDLTGNLRALNLNTVVASLPVTSVTGSVRANGAGTSLATLRGTFAADLAASSWDSVSIDNGTVRVAISNGLASIQRLHAAGRSTRIDAAGTLGLVAGRTGELRYTIAIDSLGAYNRLIPGASETGVVPPRPAVVARAMERARQDSIRIARATEVERAATGRPMPRIQPDIPPTLARNALSGQVYTAGVLRGNIHNFDLRGRLTAENVVARGNSVESLRAEYAWNDARTSRSTFAVGVEGSDIFLRGYAFDTLQGRLSYRRPNGEIQLALRQGNDRDYSVRGSFVAGSTREIRVNELAVRMDTTVWTLARPALVYWRPAGVEVRNLELRSNTGGMVFASGLLPTEGNANLVIDVRNFQIADIAMFVQSDLPITGILTARGVVQGSMRNPRFRGAAGLINGNYNGSVIPDFQGTFRYANASLVAHVEALRTGRSASVVADAVIPINLAITGVTGPRVLDAPLRVDVVGDSLPLDLIPAVTDLVANIRGVAAGRLAMRGTLRRPTFTGALTWLDGSMVIVPTGVTVEQITASIRMARDTVFVDSIAGRAGQGPVRLSGRMYVGDWRAPRFDLHYTAVDALVLDNERGELEADVGLSLTGPWDSAYVAGLVHVREGVLYIPEPDNKQVVNPGDPAVFAILDTAITNDRELFPTSSPLLENMRIDVDVSVNRNTWLRSRDANIEMYTEEPLRVHRSADALALTGVVSTERGEYTFLSKRFEIKRGSATFVGGPELNPAIQATGEYEVALAGRQAFNIRVLIGGTMRRPKLTLESDAQPPIPQSDLLSYLAFGQSTTSLLSIEGSGLTGATATGHLVGVGAALATQRMIAVALGVMVDEVEGDATRGLGADVFNITPADLPTELGNVGTFLQGTRIEAGKYLSPYFFTALQLQQHPGLRAEYRAPNGWRFEAAIEPRYLLQPPTLGEQRIPSVTSFGAFIIRQWRF